VVGLCKVENGISFALHNSRWFSEHVVRLHVTRCAHLE
jgi:hypothetical protein